jgi:Ribbon-helix-helix protein, copG family
MTPTRLTNFRIDEKLLEALEAIRERDGVPVSEQVRRGILLWLESKGVSVKTERKRAGTRRRP